MGTVKDLLEGVREVIRLTDDVRRNAEGLSALAREMREFDARLIAVETKVDVMLGLATAKAAHLSPPPLPGDARKTRKPKRG
jgi:hypothetical protein